MRRIIAAVLLLTGMLFLQGCSPEPFECGFLASWSPDGCRAALVPNLLDEEETESGIWIFEAESGSLHRIFQAEPGYYCLHPRWSPYGAELLFALVRVPREDSGVDDDDLEVSVWIIGVDGSGLREVARTRFLADSALWPNRIAWGPLPDTIVIEKRTGSDSSTAELIDARTDERRQFLPDSAAAWIYQLAPSRQQAAAVLSGADSEAVYLADMPEMNWRKLWEKEKVPRSRTGSRHVPAVSWSPDSASFVVAEFEPRQRPAESDRHWLRLFDLRSGEKRRAAEGKPDGPVVWAPDGTRFVFAGYGPGKQTGIFEIDLVSGAQSCAFPGEGLRVLAWHREGGVISYFRQPKGNENMREDGHSAGTPVGIANRILEGEAGWNVSPDGSHALFFGESGAVLALDLPYGDRMRWLELTARQEMKLPR